MHTPSKFKQNDESQLTAIMREYSFATLITHSGAGIEANHLPVIVLETEGQITIQAHIAKANKLWKTVNDGSDILLIFNGPNCYVSPNYYPTKKETGKAVPTWNYVVVHVKGKVRFIHDDSWIYNMIDTLSKQHEATQTQPWSITDAPTEYINKMLPALVGIEVTVDSMQGQWKLSQNQPDINKQGVAQGLSENGNEQQHKISELIKALE